MDKPFDTLGSEVTPMVGVARRTDYILILSGTKLVQETLALVFAHTLGCTNVLSAGTLPEVRALTATELPQLVMVDATLKEGRAAVRLLQNHDSTVRLIAFCVDDASDWAAAGVSECLSRTASCKEIAALVASILARKAEPPPAVATAPAAPKGASCPVLTEREEEVAQLINAGLSNKDIAHAMGISLATVKSHVHNLLAKLGLGRRGKVAMWYGSRRPLTERRKPLDLLQFVAIEASRVHTAQPPSVG